MDQSTSLTNNMIIVMTLYSQEKKSTFPVQTNVIIKYVRGKGTYN